MKNLKLPLIISRGTLPSGDEACTTGETTVDRSKHRWINLSNKSLHETRHSVDADL